MTRNLINETLGDLNAAIDKERENVISSALDLSFRTKSDVKPLETVQTSAQAPEINYEAFKNAMNSISLGYKVIESKNITKNEKCKWRKKKRINKKFFKRYGQRFVRVPNSSVFIFNDSLVGHPTTIKKIVSEIRKGEKKRYE